MKIDINKDWGVAICNKNIPQPTTRMMLKLNKCDTDVNFLYDPESYVTIMTKQVYDSLKSEPPFQSINTPATEFARSTIKFDGITHVNIKSPKNNSADTYALENQSVLVFIYSSLNHYLPNKNWK